MTEILPRFVDFLGAHQTLAVVFAFLVAFGEALLIVGLFVPSTVVLVGLGTLIGLGKLTFAPIFVATVLGAIAGDALSFWAGVHWKQRILTFWPFSHYGVLMAQGERFVARHGGKSIFFVRFVPGLKAVVPTIAGMMGMNGTRFAVINVVSAFFWAAVHVLPGVAIGQGLQVAHAANPRLEVVVVLGVVVLVAVWGGWHLMRGVVLPWADRGRLRLAVWLDDKGVRGVARMLHNADGQLGTAGLVALTLCSLAGLGWLVLAVVYNPEMALADAAIGQFLQGLRSGWANSVLIGATMLGDMAVLLPLVLAMIVALAAYRQWVLAGCVAAAALAGAGFVPLFKALLHRARPLAMYQGNDGFSFPSGHSTFATIIFGILALFVARMVPRWARVWVYGAFAALIGLIALSRVCLLAHWPSDVVAGVLFGVVVICGAALVLRGRAVPRRALAGMLVVVGLGVIPWHLTTGWSLAAARYDATLPMTVMAQGDWQAEGWRTVSASRIRMDGDAGEAMLVQTDLDLGAVVTALQAAGWTLSQASRLDQTLDVVLPSRAGVAVQAPWPLTDLGRPALATLTMPGPDAARRVLRVWRTGVSVDGAGLLQISVTDEALAALAFGYGVLREMPVMDVEAARAGVVTALTPIARNAVDKVDGVVLFGR